MADTEVEHDISS